MVTCHKPLAATTALEEATALWPTRRTSSDGICASASHHQQNPGSDHEPSILINGHYYASAFDLSDDKASGCDADWLVEQLRIRHDPRIKYVIAERRMYSSYATSVTPAWQWRPYNGPNPHTSHVHVSIVRSHLFNPDPWWGPLLHNSQEVEDMTQDEKDMLARVHHEITVGNLPKLVTMVRDLEKEVEALKAKVG